MMPKNAAVTVTDVLNYHQKQGHFNVSKRSFSAISLRLNTTENIFGAIKSFPLNLRAYVLSQRGYLTSAYPLRTMYSLYILIF